MDITVQFSKVPTPINVTFVGGSGGGGGGGSGTVTSVGSLSPLFTTTNPTTNPTFSAISQGANLVYAGPTSGGSALPTFRTLVSADLPTMVTSATSLIPTGVLFADGSQSATTIAGFTLTQPFGGAVLTLTNAIGGTVDISGNKVLIDDHASSAADYSSHGLDVIGAAAYYEIKEVGVTNFPGIKYFADYSANFVARSLVDKAYVDARVGMTNPMTTIGDLIQGTAAGAPARLADVAVGSYLRSGGVGTAVVWSTTTIPNTVATGDLWQGTATNAVSVLASVATGNALISGGVTTASTWGKITSAHVDSTVALTASSWQVTGTSTFTGAVLIDETTTGGNTLKFKAASLGTTQVNGKGIWLYNDTAAANGAQQISPSLVFDAQGWQTNTPGSQSVKFAQYVTPIQGAANPSGSLDWYTSINAGANTNLMTLLSGGQLGVGTNTPNLVNAINYGVIAQLHVSSAGSTGVVIDCAGGFTPYLIFNDRGQAAGSKVWAISTSVNLLFQTATDGLSTTNVFQLTRAGNASWLGSSYFGALTAPIHTVDVGGSFGAAITSTSTDITLGATHYTVKVDASGANRTITLPAAAGVTRRIYIIKKTDATANTVTIDGNASETIDGATTKVINTQYAGYAIQCDGSSWFIIATF